MNVELGMFRLILPVIVAVFVTGCIPVSDSQLDEQKDPYYLAGQRKLSSFDYRPAAEAFEKALEVNPRSASAHFQLGLLYEQRITEENSYAIAIYHYNRFLQLRPKSDYADIVRQRIIACKQELAKPIALAPGTQSVLRDLERLKVENTQLRNQLEAWVAYATNRSSYVTPMPSQIIPSPNLAPTMGNMTLPPNYLTASNPATSYTPNSQNNNPSSRAAKVHKVQANDTLAGIAKRYGVSVRALTTANPTMDPRRLKIGQNVNVPAK